MSPQWCGHSHAHTTGGRRRCVQPAGRVVVYSLGCCRRLEDELLHQKSPPAGHADSLFTGLQVPVVLWGYQACSCSLFWPFVHGPAALVLPCVLQPHQLSFGRAGEASVVVQFPLALRRLVGRSLL